MQVLKRFNVKKRRKERMGGGEGREEGMVGWNAGGGEGWGGRMAGKGGREGGNWEINLFSAEAWIRDFQIPFQHKFSDPSLASRIYGLPQKKNG